MVAIFHRICPANPEALTLFFAVLRNYISRTVKATTIDVEVSLPPPGFSPTPSSYNCFLYQRLFTTWNIERIARISREDGTVPYKWCEDQLTKIVNARVTKAEEAASTSIAAVAEVQALAKDDPVLRKRLTATFGGTFQSTKNNNTGNGTGRKRQQGQANTPTKKQKPGQQTRQPKQNGPQLCR